MGVGVQHKTINLNLTQSTVSAQERQKEELPWRLNYCSSPEDAFFKHGLNSGICAIPVILITSQDLAFWDGFIVNSYKHPGDKGECRGEKRELKKTNNQKKKLNKTNNKPQYESEYYAR